MEVEGEIGHKNVKAFIEKLDQKIHEAKDMLIERFDFICSQSADSAKFMYENGLMAGYIPEEGIRSALKHRNTCSGLIPNKWPTLNTLNCGNALRALITKLIW